MMMKFEAVVFLMVVIVPHMTVIGSSEPLDCSEITCLTCPEDSLTIIDSTPLDVSPDPATSSESLLNNAIPSSGTHSPPDNSASNELIISGKAKRAVKPFKRERIRIVPGGYEYFQRKRRNIIHPSINYEIVSEQKIFECCSRRKCECDDTRCAQMRPICEPNQVLILTRNATKSPGDCCSEFRCDSEPDCVAKKEIDGIITITLRDRDQHTEWVNGCKSCVCEEGAKVCKNICHSHENHPVEVGVALPSETEKPATCYSQSHDRHFARNATWNEDDCTRCVCDDSGMPICHSSVCKPKNCAKQVLIPGQCCPVCDLRDSKLCAGHSDCGIVCRYGLDVNPVTGCEVCKCAKSWPPSHTSVEPPRSPPLHPELDSTIDTNIVQRKGNEFNIVFYLPILIVICLSIILFMFIVGLTCKYMHYNKDKYCVNKKMYDNNLTPLI